MDINAQNIDGTYHTPGKGSPFIVRYRDGEIHCFHASRGQNIPDDAQGNVVFQNPEEIIAGLRSMLAISGDMRLGATPENRIPDPDTLEALLRAYATGGNLASYFPPIAERLGVIEVFKSGRALSCRPPRIGS